MPLCTPNMRRLIGAHYCPFPGQGFYSLRVRCSVGITTCCTGCVLFLWPHPHFIAASSISASYSFSSTRPAISCVSECTAAAVASPNPSTTPAATTVFCHSSAPRPVRRSRCLIAMRRHRCHNICTVFCRRWLRRHRSLAVGSATAPSPQSVYSHPSPLAAPAPPSDVPVVPRGIQLGLNPLQQQAQPDSSIPPNL